MIVIRSGEVLTPDGWRFADVVIEGGRVVDVGDGPRGGAEVDAMGCLVGPAFVDLHTHLREPGQTWKEDIASGSIAAATGGFAAIVAMPNTDPPIDTTKVAEEVAARGEEVGLVDLAVAGALTEGRAGASLADIEGMYEAGVRLFTDDGDTVADAEVLRQAMTVIAALPGARIAQHAEDSVRTDGGQVHEGEMSRRLGVPGIPAEAEADIVARDLELAAATGARYHCQHVSSHLTVSLIAAAKKDRLPVTAEVTPHHLSFDDSELVGLDTDFKMYPPLRSTRDRASLVKALQRGIIDAVATDHAPHAPAEKQVPFDAAPRGVIGLETAAAATWQVLEERDRFFEVMSLMPARIAGLPRHGRPISPGSPANLVVFQPEAEWVPQAFHSKSANSPWKGRQLRGVVRATVHRGRVSYSGGRDR